MDEEVTRFRAAAALQNRGRGRMGRRYSAALRAQAVRYWSQREPEGDVLSDVAAALGVAPWSLQRWARAPRVRPVQVVPPVTRPVVSSLVVVLTSDSVRIEGLDLKTAAHLVAARVAAPPRRGLGDPSDADSNAPAPHIATGDGDIELRFHDAGSGTVTVDVLGTIRGSGAATTNDTGVPRI